ncbi:YggS family pyridoxal phosphate-dependent enzyme [Jeotgalibaca sp. YN-L-12]|nr:YggS family pyridoxal phosphate-dependent enzyme [Jeotgalibaca caeni]MDE1547930.1 YggS family pyridoxal phosphate-dependent enzyme [Jeotgalibaca caeni]
MSIISKNCQQIETVIAEQVEASGRSLEEVTCVAVTKMRSLEEVAELYQQGYRHFAENRPEGLKEKQAAFPHSDIHWHYIGSLQTRKVKQVINEIAFFHALDRESLAKEIEKRANHTVSCFVQVNVTGETSKQGVSPCDLMPFIESLGAYSKISVVGLMTMAPIDATEDELRTCFQTLKQLQTSIAKQQYPHAPCLETSMGMSNDYPIALQEGATFIRIGSAFFE